MKQVRLSDHASGMVDHIRNEREARNAALVAAYEAKIAEKEARLEAMSKRRVQAWRDGRYGSWLLQGLHFLWAASGGHPDQPRLEAATREEKRWGAGSEGETAVANFLASRLNDDWTLVGGYQNSGGEIDYLLVGPAGLVALEVKHRNGAVSITGDSWLVDKYDRYGNLVERAVAMVDKGGRSPARQLNEATDRLVQFLQREMPGATALRVVVLTHERSRLESVSQPTAIPVVLNQWPLLDMFKLSAFRLAPEDRERVLSLIRRDHEHHSKRSGRPTSGTTRRDERRKAG